MRLSKIKLAGFKSFVDPTSIHLPSNLMGVVGPNGCGKSNVIDAVRWVMGETSAKHLRGDSMADVIFNGSSTRKPVGNASIELVFDNSDGAIGGQYAKYSEISIKRVVSRDGTSQFFLNNTRCRRKDITHIFLGTGLGSRSYAIIEQGMISRLIEAKPDELRTYLEEAAGISKYKDRRRETERRIRHTKENLERLNDLRDEVDKQIRHLQRQARTAERFKKLKESERRSAAELLGLKLRDLDQVLAARSQRASERETALQAAIAEQRSLEARIEQLRANHAEHTDGFNEVQARYFRLGADLARLEQGIQHAQEIRQREQQQLEEARAGHKEISAHIEKDEYQLGELRELLQRLEPEYEQATAAEEHSAARLRDAEEALQAWRLEWEQNSAQLGEARRNSEVERTRIEHLEGELTRQSARQEKIAGELGGNTQDELNSSLQEQVASEAREQESLQGVERQLATVIGDIAAARKEEAHLVQALDEGKGELQRRAGQLASLAAVQGAALGQTGGQTTKWLEHHGLADYPRMAQKLEVQSGWERAVETVLGTYLEAVCVPGIDSVSDVLGSLDRGVVTFIEPADDEVERPAGQGGEALSDKVHGEGVLAAPLLKSVRVVPDLSEALRLRQSLGRGESVITREGIWLGPNWLRIARQTDEHAGILAREKEIRALRPRVDEARNTVGDLEATLIAARERLSRLEAEREDCQVRVNQAHRVCSAREAEIHALRAQLEQATAQANALSRESSEIEEHIGNARQQLQASRGSLERLLDELANSDEGRLELETQHAALTTQYEEAKSAAASDRAAVREIAIRVESRRSSQQSAQQGLQRMSEQLTRFESRQDELLRLLEEGEAPLKAQQIELEERLQARIGVEQELAAARKTLEEVDDLLRRATQEHAEFEMQVGDAREAVNSAHLAVQETQVRKEGLGEQFAETGLDLEILMTELEEDATVGGCEEKLEGLRLRIGRLGPINLAAIEEFKEQTERKEYLDSQFEDLTQALDTLEGAIRKIDKETRTRFKETFDKVNAGLKEIFPRLFGGGHAYLELTGEDLLQAGVTVMARPPGKRNSSIHLLSGGEKALTAVALVFSIFELNPAPFCLLDEVDAPLDDSNVTRFCDIVREMSHRVQFLFITHNKITMEMAHQLTGVTMNEPGVSRLVAVDVDEAVQMVAV